MSVFAGATKVADTKKPDDMTVAELRALAKERGIEVSSKATKAKLLELLGV